MGTAAIDDLTFYYASALSAFLACAAVGLVVELKFAGKAVNIAVVGH